MPARLMFHRKRILADGMIVELKLWEVEPSIPGSPHRLKYSLFYGSELAGRVIGYDNERGKGDHRHHGDREEPFQWRGVRQLVADFLHDVRNLRQEGDDHG